MLDLHASQIIIQIIAFLIMLWIMKRYGWQPLLQVLEERRQKIQTEFDSIHAQKEEIKQTSLLYEEKLKKIDADARKKIQEAVTEAHKISMKIHGDAQNSAREILQKAKSEIENEIAKAKNQLKDEMVQIVIKTTEKVLQTKLDAPSQKKLIASFVEEIQLK